MQTKPLIILFFFLLLPLPLMAGQVNNQHNGHNMDMNSMQQGDMFLVKKNIDGYLVSFHVMRATPGMEHGGSHNFMVKIEKNGQPLGNIMINSKIIDPEGQAKSKRLMKMGDWFMNGYDLAKPGRYQLLILFKTSDGKKHKGGVYYGD